MKTDFSLWELTYREFPVSQVENTKQICKTIYITLGLIIWGEKGDFMHSQPTKYKLSGNRKKKHTLSFTYLQIIVHMKLTWQKENFVYKKV